MGFLTALIVGYANGANVLFWLAAVLAGIGASLFLSGMARR
jgi:hypothetical protein